MEDDTTTETRDDLDDRATAEEITNLVQQLEDVTRRNAVRDVIATLEEGWEMEAEDEDTWAAGFAAAMDVIKANFVM